MYQGSVYRGEEHRRVEEVDLPWLNQSTLCNLAHHEINHVYLRSRFEFIARSALLESLCSSQQSGATRVGSNPTLFIFVFFGAYPGR